MSLNNSILTNTGAMIALQNLAQINTNLKATENRVSTGLKVASAQDNASVFAVAQGLRGNVKAYDAVATALAGSQGVISVATSAATSISNAMQDIKTKLTQLSDDSLSATQRTYYNNDLQSLVNQINTSFIQGAYYNGVNLLNSSATVSVLASVNGSTISYGGTTDQLSVAMGTFLSAITTEMAATDGTAALSMINGSGAWDTFNNAVNAVLDNLGSVNRSLGDQITFNQSVSDSTQTGLGALVDADLAKESANLTAIQTQQQLATQTLSIANSQPQILLSLFKGG
ncbi:MAG TPA: flagellin [Alphaproteobacteria bacterium]|nr:flagellin [Alphaproteobacteria bacterium]